MEPISLAVLTAAATTLGTKTIEGFGGEAGKSLWGQVRAALGWSNEPAPKELALMLARRLNEDEAAAVRVAELLKGNSVVGAGIVQHLVENINTSGGKVTVIGSQTAKVMVNQF